LLIQTGFVSFIHISLMVGGAGLAILDVFGRHWDFTFAFAGWTSLHPAVNISAAFTRADFTCLGFYCILRLSVNVSIGTAAG
jgi:hypothetical protein